MGGQPPATSDFTFFAFGDLHAGQSADTDMAGKTGMAQMKMLDPNAVGAFNNGDLIDDDTAANWSKHDAAVAMAGFNADATAFGSAAIRYLASMDNHDRGFPTERSGWLTDWNQHLKGQSGLGHNGTDGIYYSVSYANTLFILLDSQHPSADQTTWLKTLLASDAAQKAEVKIAFFHEPVYPCSTDHPPFADGLAWLDLFEKNRVHLAFVSHMHFYDRTCSLVGATCKTDGSGVVYQQLGPLGADNFRTVNRTSVTVTGVDASGAARSDTYACSGAKSIFTMQKTNVNDFCHVHVKGCQITGDCYEVRAGNMTPFDSWTVDGCAK